MRLDLALFEYVAHGFLDATCDILTPIEIDHLVFGARLITYEQAIRFLGDYLNGDTYYKTHRPDHNLDRCRTQIKLLTEIEQQMDHAERHRGQVSVGRSPWFRSRLRSKRSNS